MLHFTRSRGYALLSLGALALVIMIASVTLADLPDDGRINIVHHFGGDALYCVDANMNPTTQYSDNGEGGFRLLDMQGQVLWFVPQAVVSEAAAQSQANQQTVLVAEGSGTYGPTQLYATVTPEGDVTFIFFGYDEYGKQNSITFKFCEPVGPIPDPGSPDEPDEDDPITTDEPTPTDEPTEEPVQMCWPEASFDGQWFAFGDQIPCDECPPVRQGPLFQDLPDIGLACTAGISGGD